MPPEMERQRKEEMDLDQFQCIQCHACCRQSGYVRLHPHEPDYIAAHLKMDVLDFIQTHTRLTRDRECLSLNDQENGACTFLGDKGCQIHPVKPVQCRTFPHKWKFSDFETTCGWAIQQKKRQKS